MKKILSVLFLLILSVSATQAQYCVPSFSTGTTSNDYIEEIAVGTYINTTGASSAPYYLTYPTTITGFNAGSSTIIRVRSGNFASNVYSVWIDYNSDFDFDDPNEKIGEQTTTAAFQDVFFAANVPLINSTTTRMRVVCSYNVTGMLPCGSYTYGEAEDYFVNISSSLNPYCVPVPTNGTNFGDYIESFAINTISNFNSGFNGGPSYTFYSGLSTTLNYGTNYFVNLVSGSAPSNTYAIWIDLNADNDFFDAGEKLLEITGTTANTNYNPTVAIPAGTGSLNTRLRVRSVYSTTNIDPCTNYTYGETEDYPITLQSAGGCTPTHGTACSTVDNINSFSISTTSLSNLNTGCTSFNGQAYSIYPASGNTTATLTQGSAYTFNVTTAGSSIISVWIDYNQNLVYEASEWTQITTASTAGVAASQTIVIPTNALTGSTGIRVRARASGSPNGATDACTQFFSGETEDYTVTIQSPSGFYCTPIHGAACTGDNILNVSIPTTNLLNASTCDNLTGQAYTNWPATFPYTANLTLGNTYTLSVTTAGNHIISAWIDWNQNGTFETTEWTQVATSSTGSLANNVNFTVPINALTGQTRMRVRARAAGSPNGAGDACTQFFSGETEDYTLNIINNSGQAPIANFSAGPGSFGLNFTDLSANNPTSWTWNFDDAYPAISIDQNPLDVVFFSPGCHSVTLTVSNAFGTDVLFIPCAVVVNDGSTCVNPIISEYIEGTGNNKAIEIYNPTNGTLSLNGYGLSIYANGSDVPTSTITLAGTIAAHDVFVVTNPGASLAQITSNSDLSSANLNFNGNDAVGLTFNGRVIDLIGEINEDSSWVVGAGSTTDFTLVRQANVVAPEAFWNTARGTYTVFATNTTSNLGSHIGICNTVASQCATNNTSCTTTNTGVIGTLTTSNSTTTYPAPYGNFYKASRHQFLFLASELNAAGVQAGNINALSFNIANLNASTTLYKNFTIKMGCTSATDLTSGTYDPNVLTVFDPKDALVTATGWRQHNFDRNFSWDGVSNVIVEVSHDNTADANYTQNMSTYYSTTPVARTIYFASDVYPGSAVVGGTAVTERTTTRFHYCASTQNPPVAQFTIPVDSICAGSCANIINQSIGTNLSYSWSFPGGNPASSTQANPQVCYTNPGTYQVTLTVTGPGGSDTETSQIYVFPNPVAQVTPSQSNICPGNSVQLFATGGTSYVWTPPTGLSNPNIANPIASPTTTTTYVVSVSNGVCSSTAGAVVIVTPITVDAGQNQSICPGSSTGLNAVSNAGSGATYTWFPATGLSNPNIPNPIANPTVTTTYTVTVNSNGCTATDVITITVQPVNANAGQDQSICAGGSAQLNASGGTSYFWSPSAGLSNPNIANPIASPSVTTTYTVTVISGNNCSATDQVVVTVNNVSADAGQDVTICPGGFVQLNATGGSTYQWTPSVGLSNPNIANPIASPTSTTTYTVIVSNNGCTATDVIVVSVGQVNANAGQDQTICAGSTAQLNASGGATYSWFPATGLSNPNIANPVASPSTTTTYTVTVSSGNCSSTDQVTITVNSASVNAGQDQTVCAGGSVQLNAVGNGQVFWTPAIGLSSQTVPNPIATPLQTTTYTVTILNNGCTASDDVTVTVNQVNADAGQNQTICAGASAQLLATGGTQYSWSPATGLNNPNIAAPLASPASTTTYTVTVFNNGCSATDVVTVTVNSAQVVAGPDQSICAGSSAQLSSTGTGSYSWSPATGLNNPTTANPVASPSTTTLYTVTVNNNGCTATDQVLVTVINVTANAGQDQSICAGGTVQLSASGGTSFSWSPATGLNNPNLPNPIASPTQTTTYTVTVSNGNCSSTDQVTVTVNAPFVQTGPDQNICAGASANLVATGGTNYQWSPASSLNNPNIQNPVATPTVTTTYIVSTTLGNCVATDSVTVTVINVLANAGPDVTLCAGSSVQLNGSGGDSYLWTPNSGINNQTDQNPIVNPSTTTTYTLSATIGNCVATDEVVVTVVPGVANPNAGSDTSICAGGSVNLNASGGTSYSWFPSTGLSNPAVANPVASPSATTTYVVTINDGNCSASDEVTITVNSINADAGLNQSICAGSVAQLNATGGTTYSWTPSGTLSNPSIQNPIASPLQTTSYLVTVSDGTCSATDSVTVEVINVSADAGQDLTVCIGSSIALNGSGNGTFVWSPATGLSDANIANPLATPTATTTYTLTVSIGNCVSTDQVIVNVDQAVLNLAAGGDTTLCGAGTVQLSASGASNYSWSPATGLNDAFIPNPVASVSGSGTIVYTVTASNGTCSASEQVSITIDSINVSAGSDVSVCNGASVQLNATGGNTYQWSPATGLDNAGVATPNASPAQTTTYTVTVSNGVCTASDEVVVTVNTINLNAGSDLVICEGDSVQLNGTGADGYSWFPASFLSNPQIENPVATPSVTTTYYLTGTQNGCVAYDTLTISVNPLPQPVITQIGSDLSTGVYASYQWQLNGVDIPGATFQGHFPAQVGNYTVTVTTADGCSNTSAPYQVLIVSAGVAENSFNWSVFPNPAAQDVNIRMEQSQGEMVNLVIYNSLGQVVYTFVSEQNTRILNLNVPVSEWADGVYVIQMNSGSKVHIARLVKN